MTEENNIILTEDDPEGLGLVIPEKLDKYFSEPIEGSLDVKAVLHADPRKLDDFMETLEYVRNWVSYTAVDNKANLITFTKKAIENAKIESNDGNEYVMLSTLINSMQIMIDIIKPIVDSYEQEVREKNRKQMERRAKQDEEAEWIRLAEKDRVRRESLEKSRMFSQNMREAEERRRQAAFRQDEDNEW